MTVLKKRDHKDGAGASSLDAAQTRSPAARLAARLLLGLARAVAALTLAGLALKAVGEIVSDRYAWSQWLEWAPNVLVWCAALSALAVAGVSARLATVAGGRRAPARGLLLAALIALLAHGVYTVIAEVPFYRPPPPAPRQGAPTLRVAFWNAGAGERDGWERGVIAAHADLVVAVGLSSRAALTGIRAAMPEGTVRLVYERFSVMSSRPLARYGFTSLNIEPGRGIDPRLPEGRRARHDPGAAMYLELAGQAGAPVVVWLVDLPSDLSLGRWEVAGEARRAIDEFQGQRMVWTGPGGWVVEAGTGFSGPKGFPTPDLIIGDFNIPRGAASLSRLNPGYTDAFDAAATGYVASWPRRWPLLHLDQAFIGPNLRAWTYALRDIGSGQHLMQVLDVEGK